MESAIEPYAEYVQKAFKEARALVPVPELNEFFDEVENAFWDHFWGNNG